MVLIEGNMMLIKGNMMLIEGKMMLIKEKNGVKLRKHVYVKTSVKEIN